LVSDKLPSREQAVELLRKNNCPPVVISHCESVAWIALEIVDQLVKKGIKVDRKLVEAGALLHDLGRSKTNSINHGIEGAKIAESEGLPVTLVRIIERHIGGGITAEEAKAFGWSKGVYVPVTLEEKIVSYSDKLIDQSNRVPIDLEIERLRMENKNKAAERVRKLHEEIKILLGN